MMSMKLKLGQVDFIKQIEEYLRDGVDEETFKKWLLEITEEPTVNDRQVDAIKKTVQEGTINNQHEKLEQVITWFKTQPHLPQPEPGFVYKFLWAAKYDVEHCKKVLVNYYNLRGTDEDIFGNRDPCTLEAKQLYASSHFTCLPGFTDDLYRVTFSALTTLDPESFHPKEWIRRVINIADLRARDDFCLGDIVIYDLTGFTMMHLMKFPITLAKKLLVATERALPSKIKGIHMINCPPFVDKIVSLFKPFMKEKLASRVHVHTSYPDTLYEHIPQHLLPNEYGGSAGPLADLSQIWKDELEKNRDWFIEQETKIKGMYAEAKKAGKLFVDSGDMFGIEGSFKKLDID